MFAETRRCLLRLIVVLRTRRNSYGISLVRAIGAWAERDEITWLLVAGRGGCKKVPRQRAEGF